MVGFKERGRQFKSYSLVFKKPEDPAFGINAIGMGWLYQAGHKSLAYYYYLKIDDLKNILSKQDFNLLLAPCQPFDNPLYPSLKNNQYGFISLIYRIEVELDSAFAQLLKNNLLPKSFAYQKGDVLMYQLSITSIKQNIDQGFDVNNINRIPAVVSGNNTLLFE